MAAPQSTPLPEAPTRGEAEGQFVPKANAFVGALEPFRQQLQAQADFVNDRSIEAEENAGRASDASDIALSNANFRGSWSGLSGSFEVPTSVLHNDNYWQLVENVANIQNEEPGASAVWSPINIARFGVRSLPDITALSELDTGGLVDGQQFSVSGWRTGESALSGMYEYKTGRPKSDHDGLWAVSPTVPGIGVGGQTEQGFINGDGETDPGGAGVFVRKSEAVVYASDYAEPPTAAAISSAADLATLLGIKSVNVGTRDFSLDSRPNLRGLDIVGGGCTITTNGNRFRDVGRITGVRQNDGTVDRLMDRPLKPTPGIASSRMKAFFRGRTSTTEDKLFVVSQGGSDEDGTAFEIFEGNVVAPNEPSNSVNQNWEYWRVGPVQCVSRLFLWKSFDAETSGSWEDWSPPSTDFPGTPRIPLVFRTSSDSGAAAEFTAQADQRGIIRVLFYGTNASPTSQDILVDGSVEKTVNLQDAGVFFVEIQSTPGEHTVTIEKDPSGNNIYIAGVNAYRLCELDSLTAEHAYDSVAMYIRSPHYTLDVGAHDYAFSSRETGLTAGSYHGGQTRRSPAEFNVSGVSVDPTPSDFVVVGRSISLFQQTTISWAPESVEFLDVDEVLVFGDSETQQTVAVKGDLRANTIYAGMSGTSTAFESLWGPVYTGDVREQSGTVPIGHCTQFTQREPVSGRMVSLEFTDLGMLSNPTYGGASMLISGNYNKVYWAQIRNSDTQFEQASWVYTRRFR